MKKKFFALAILLIVWTLAGLILFRSWWDRTSFSRWLQDSIQNLTQTAVKNDPLLGGADSVSAWNELDETVNDAVNNAVNNGFDDGQQDAWAWESIAETIESVWFTKQQFLWAYEKAMAVHDWHLKLNIATTLYETYGDERVIPLIVLMAMQQKNLDKAGEYLALLDRYDPEVIDRIGVYPIINILLNESVWSDHLDDVKEYVERLDKENRIGTDDKNFYYSLIALWRGDMVHFRHFSDQLVDSETYWERYQRLQSIQQQVTQYEYAPEYFYNWLLWVELFYEWWYRLAIEQWKIISATDSSYQLWYQLQWNGLLFMSKRAEASQLYEQLKSLDDKPIYTFLQWISAYNWWRYNESILLLKQLRNTPYQLDVKRYLLLSYASIGDRSGVSDTMKSLIWYELTPYDYFTMFDILFFDYLNSEGDENRFQWANSDIAGILLKQCRSDLWEQYGFVCLYGQSGQLYYDWDYSRALPLMQWLTQWYPTARIHERIGHIAWEKWDVELAKESFLKAFAASEDTTQSQYLRWRITEIVKEQ